MICSSSRCRGHSEIIYLGKSLCWECWKKMCKKELEGSEEK